MLTQQIDTWWKRWKKGGNKYLTFASTGGNKEVLKKYTRIWDGIKYLIKIINVGKSGKYGKDFMKTKLNSDNGLPLNKPLKLHAVAIIIRSVFEENGKYYPQIFLDKCLYVL